MGVSRQERVAIPESTRSPLTWKLSAHQRKHWPRLKEVKVRSRGDLVYLDGVLADGDLQPLCRLRYGGSATTWGFAIYLARKDGYQDSVLPRRL
jgi:hypothetical protein